MRMTLTGFLSQPCHPTLTLLIPHVTQGVLHNARRTVNSHLTALVHVFTHTNTITAAPTKTCEFCALDKHVQTHTHPEAGEEVCGSSLVVAWLQWSGWEIRSADPFRVLMERCGIKGDQRPDRLIEERYLVWATPQDTVYCWHFAWEIQREAGRLNPSYLGFVFNRLEAGPSSLGKWQSTCLYVCACERTWAANSESVFILRTYY